MKRLAIVLLLMLTLLVTIILGASPAAAEPVYETETTGTFCSMASPLRYWEAGNTVHGRDEHYEMVYESTDPLFDGTANIWGNWNINLDTMKGLGWGEFDQAVPEFDGGWAGSYQGEMYIAWPLVIRDNGHPLWLAIYRGNAHGYGAFRGLQSHFEAYTRVFVGDQIPEGVPCITGVTYYGEPFVMQEVSIGRITGKE